MIRITRAFKFAHNGYQVLQYDCGDQVLADSEVGRFALEAGYAVPVSMPESTPPKEEKRRRGNRR